MCVGVCEVCEWMVCEQRSRHFIPGRITQNIRISASLAPGRGEERVVLIVRGCPRTHRNIVLAPSQDQTMNLTPLSSLVRSSYVRELHNFTSAGWKGTNDSLEGCQHQQHTTWLLRLSIKVQLLSIQWNFSQAKPTFYISKYNSHTNLVMSYFRIPIDPSFDFVADSLNI